MGAVAIATGAAVVGGAMAMATEAVVVAEAAMVAEAIAVATELARAAKAMVVATAAQTVVAESMAMATGGVGGRSAGEYIEAPTEDAVDGTAACRWDRKDHSIKAEAPLCTA